MFSVIDALVENVGASKSFQNNFDRKLLLDLLPRRQEDLPPRRMSVSNLFLYPEIHKDKDLKIKIGLPRGKKKKKSIVFSNN